MRTLKKSLLLLFVTLTLAVIFCFGSSALSSSGSCGKNVTYTYNSTTKELVISGSGAITAYTPGGSPFWDSDIKSVVIKEGVTTIGGRAFGCCRSLQSVTIGNSVTTIDSYAFEDCYSLQSITIPDSVTTMDGSAFSFCNSLQSVTVDKNNKYYCNDDYGVLFNKNKTKFIQYTVGNKRTAYTIPDSVTTIGDYAFCSCESLQIVAIPDSVTVIGSSAFRDCTSLQSVTIPDGVTTIGDYAFEDCTSLQSVTIGNSVTTIGSYAFVGCDSLQSVTIGNSVTTIGNWAFAWCESLQSITIPDSVTTIGDCAFSHCDSLLDVYYKGTKEQWKNTLIGTYNNNLTDATIHYHYNNNHNEIDMEAVGSTCTEIGYTSGKYCPDCETWLEGHDEIPVISHTYESVINKATLTADGKIEYKCSCGDIEKTETIAKVSSLTLSTTKYIYDGKNKTPKLTVKDSNGKTLVKNTDYKITVASKRAGIGRYTVKVTLIGNYSGSKNLYFYILPGKSASVKSASQTVSSVKLSWSAVPGAAGYTIYRYSSSKKAYVKEGTTEGTTFTVKSLYAGKKYTFRVVAYGKTASGKTYNSETYALLKTATKTKTPILSDTVAYKGKVKLFWTATTGETGYTVYYSTSKTSGFKKYKNYESNSGYVNNLTSGKTYYFKVRTYIKTDSGYVYSAWSNVKGVKVK